MGLISKARAKPGPKGISDSQLAEALRKNVGNVLAAAQALGVTDGAIYQRLRNHPELKAIQEDAKERVTDMVKARILKRIERDDWNAINLWATTQGGFVKQTAISNPDGTAVVIPAAIQINVTYQGGKPDDEVL